VAESLTPITSLANNSVDTLIALANAIVNVMATTMVTANGASNGAITNGNGYVSGIFGGSILVAGMLRGGSVNSSANLIVGSNTWINTATLYVGNTTVNASMNSINITVATANHTNAVISFFPQSNLTFSNTSLLEVNLTTTGTSSQQLDTFLLANIRSAEYVLQVKDNSANGYQISKFLVIHDGTTPLFTEYGLLTTNSTLATFTATANATNLILSVTPSSTNTSIRALRTSLNS
jgi:hypothetical protein